MLLAVTLSALAMTLIVGVRYLIVSGAFAAATRLKHPGLYRGLDAQMRREIAWSLASAAIYGVPAGILAWGWKAHGWTRIYDDIHALPLWYVPLSVVVYLFLHDTWFYWTHRWMHRPAVFKAAHAVHHASRPPTAWAAMAFHPIEAVTGAVVIPLLVLLIPIHIGALGFVLGLMTVMGVTNHMGWEVFPRFMWGDHWGAGSSPRAIINAIMSNTGAIMGCISASGIACAAPTGGSGISRGPTPRRRARTLALAGLLPAAVVMLGAAPIARLDVGVSQMRSAKGSLRVCLTADPTISPPASTMPMPSPAPFPPRRMRCTSTACRSAITRSR